MKSSSTCSPSPLEAALAAMQFEANVVDVSVLSGADAARLLSVVSPYVHQLQAFSMALSSRVVACNQHNVAGAPSGASYVASLTGQSEKSVRSDLSIQASLSSLPDVSVALSSGSISVEKASAVVRGSDGDIGRARELLSVARFSSVEGVSRFARELQARDPVSRRERFRRQQMVRMDRRGGLDVFELALLPEHSAPLVNAYNHSCGGTTWQRAESFGSLLKMSGSRNDQVVAHLDLSIDESGELKVGDRAEIRGVGPTPVNSVFQMLERASRAFVGTVDNKLTFFSEQDRRSTTKPLPEFVKRAVKRASWDRCEIGAGDGGGRNCDRPDRCVNAAAEVDHIKARSNNGNNELTNLQSICDPHHTAKTKVDAPWTAGGIYGKHARQKRARETQERDRAQHKPELFPD